MKSHTSGLKALIRNIAKKRIKEIEVKMLLGKMNVTEALAELKILGEFENVR